VVGDVPAILTYIFKEDLGDGVRHYLKELSRHSNPILTMSDGDTIPVREICYGHFADFFTTVKAYTTSIGSTR
jgi:hypothetical protein